MNPDHLHRHCGLGDARGAPRMVPMVGCFHLLSGESLPESRTLEFQSPGFGSRFLLRGTKVISLSTNFDALLHLWVSRLPRCHHSGKEHCVTTRIRLQILTSNRVIFLPIMIFTLPLPSAATKHFPTDLTRVLQWIAFYAFIVVLSVPWILCIYQHLTSKLGRKKKMKQILTEETAPKVVVVMPGKQKSPDSTSPSLTLSSLQRRCRRPHYRHQLRG